jgi:hypothetical protein
LFAAITPCFGGCADPRGNSACDMAARSQVLADGNFILRRRAAGCERTIRCLSRTRGPAGVKRDPTILVFSLICSIVYSTSAAASGGCFTIRPGGSVISILKFALPPRRIGSERAAMGVRPAAGASTVPSTPRGDRVWRNGGHKWGLSGRFSTAGLRQHWAGAATRGRSAAGVRKSGATSCAGSFR